MSIRRLTLFNPGICRLILTKDNGCVQEIAMKVVKQIVQAVQEDLDALKKKKLRGKFKITFFPLCEKTKAEFDQN